MKKLIEKAYKKIDKKIMQPYVNPIVEFCNNKRVEILYATAALNIACGAFKCFTAFHTASVLIGISGLYNFALCIAKIPYIHWNKKQRKWNIEETIELNERKSICRMSIIIILLGALFIFFGSRMFTSGEVVQYKFYSVYGMLICAVIKLPTSIYSLIVFKRKKNPVDFTLKLANFSDALVSVVLAQSAYFVLKGIAKAAYYDGLFGIIVDTIVMIIGSISLFFTLKDMKNLY